MSSKIKNCKTCNAEIAANAKTCPNCGAKNKKPFFKKPIFYIFIVLLAVIIAVVSGGGDKEIDYQNPDITVTADVIMNDYSENAVNADEKYKDKTVEIKGKVGTISDYSLTLNGDEEDNWLTSVSVSLASGQDELIRRLSKDAAITVVGVCKSTDMFSDIKLEDAKIIEEKSELAKESSKKDAAEDDDAPIKTDINTFMKDYDSNTVSADDKYKGKTVTLTGCNVISVEDGYVRLDCDDCWSVDYVYAYYNDRESIKSISKDDVITVTGICKGEEIMDIKLTDCVFE